LIAPSCASFAQPEMTGCSAFARSWPGKWKDFDGALKDVKLLPKLKAVEAAPSRREAFDSLISEGDNRVPGLGVAFLPN
jgi:hypothetical protein